MSESTPLIKASIESLQKTQESIKLPTKAIKRLFESFLESSYPHTEEMIEAFKAGDTPSIKAKAHAIRGIALTLHFDNIGKICHLLEYEFEKIENPQTLLQSLKDEIEATQKVKEEILLQFEIQN